MDNRNGTGGNGSATETDPGAQTIQPEVLPVYQPATLPPNCMVVRREVAWGMGGVIVGAVVMYWLIQGLQGKK